MGSVANSAGVGGGAIFIPVLQVSQGQPSAGPCQSVNQSFIHSVSHSVMWCFELCMGCTQLGCLGAHKHSAHLLGYHVKDIFPVLLSLSATTLALVVNHHMGLPTFNTEPSTCSLQIYQAYCLYA